MGARHIFLVCLVAAQLSGCATLSYYTQAITGELSILANRRDISKVIADSGTPSAVRAKLAFALKARDFASRNLHLPDNDSYRSYVKLDRRYPVWVVYAAPPFSLAPITWCFPFAGCVPYRGYFGKDDAQTFAATLKQQGDDVYLGGAPAYSTLGWFADPLYSNMLCWRDTALAGLIFHELAHQLIYVQNDSAFNESFADTVQEVGITRWLKARNDAATLAAYQRGLAEQQAFQKLIDQVRERLGKIYAAAVAEDVKRQRKAETFSWLKQHYAQISRRFGNDAYAEWFSHPLNNASLQVLKTYNTWQPAFEQLLACNNGNLKAFYAAVKALAKLEPAARHTRLQSIQAGECGDSLTAGEAKQA